MVRLIVGNKGKGKTSYLLDTVNNAVREANGNIVYLDKSSKQMYDLNNRIRLIDVSTYPIKSSDALIGFICGLAASDHDLEQVYIDAFSKLAYIAEDLSNLEALINQLAEVGDMLNITFYVSIAAEVDQLPTSLKDMVAAAL